MQALYLEAIENGERLAPHEVFYRLIRRGTLEHHYEIDPADSWLVAAAQADLPVWCPGWEDSTCGNIIVSLKLKGIIDDYPIKSGLEQMETLVDWYREQDASREAGVGFFQLGGGIAGDYSVRRNSDTRTIRHVLSPSAVCLCVAAGLFRAAASTGPGGARRRAVAILRAGHRRYHELWGVQCMPTQRKNHLG